MCVNICVCMSVCVCVCVCVCVEPHNTLFLLWGGSGDGPQNPMLKALSP